MVDEYFVEMEAGDAKKHKNVQEAAALATIVIREGKLQLPRLGEKRKFSLETSPQTFGTVTCLKETLNRPFVDTTFCTSYDSGPYSPIMLEL